MASKNDKETNSNTSNTAIDETATNKRKGLSLTPLKVSQLDGLVSQSGLLKTTSCIGELNLEDIAAATTTSSTEKNVTELEILKLRENHQVQVKALEKELRESKLENQIHSEKSQVQEEACEFDDAGASDPLNEPIKRKTSVLKERAKEKTELLDVIQACNLDISPAAEEQRKRGPKRWLKIGDKSILLPLALHKEWNRNKFESPFGVMCKHNLGFLTKMVDIFYKYSQVTPPPIGALAKGATKIVEIMGQFAPDSCEEWEIDTRSGGHYYSSATLAAMQWMLQVADNIGSANGELKDSIHLSTSWIFTERVWLNFTHNFHTRVKVLNDPFVLDAWNKMLDQQDSINSIYMPALKEVLEKNSITPIGKFHHDCDLYFLEMDF